MPDNLGNLLKRRVKELYKNNLYIYAFIPVALCFANSLHSLGYAPHRQLPKSFRDNSLILSSLFFNSS